MTLSQRIVLAILELLSRIFLSWKVKGRENVPLNGPLIVVANHVHLVDGILLALSFPRWINFMAKQELFRYPFLRSIIRWAQAFSVPRRGTIKDKREVVKQAKEILNKGLVLGMFPEGKRNHDGKLLPGKSGSAVIASQAGVALLPIGITGTEKLKGISWLWKRPSIVINIGQPFEFPSSDGRLTKSQTKLSTDLMMTKIAALLPPENRGAYGD
ncbi:MAG: 1-acyl-sn-glycerol-3-phosphate acyltransferase [Dehalococcoidia bacterium]|nr:1-acyl-sn-glycerol-3-phosphate acyltransferase [Dehalococcoidia bacterium]